MTRKYRAFISYSWADRDWGEWLHRALETYRTPSALIGGETLLGPVPAGLHPIFKDREEEAAGASISASIEAAMLQSDFLIVLCSPRSAQSKWVNREVAFFKRNRDPQKILTLIVAGEPGASAMPGREAEECFPKTLLYKVDDALEPTSVPEDAPLAADARESGDGRRGAKLKIAAAMLGLGLDELVRRDERRRAVRRRIAMAASLALAVALGGLSIYAFNQRDAAVVARNEAVKARDDAEGMIELILTDLKSDLEGFGTLKSVTQIGNRAIGYYEGQDVRALTPDQLGRRARVLLMLGEADNKRGDLTAALARYETAAATTGEQLARDPDNAQRIFDHAQSVFWVGYIAWQRGDHEKAKRHFTQYYDHAQKLVAIDPENDDWQAELEYAYSNLGTLAMDSGDAAEAEGWFRKSLDVSSRLLEKHPDDIDRVLALGQSYAWLADALHRRLALAEARGERQAEIDLYSSFSGPSTNGLKRRAAIAQYRLAQIEMARGNTSDALRAASAATNEATRLLSEDPKNAELAERASFALAIRGEAEAYLGRLDEAEASLEEAITIAERLSAKDGSVTQWHGQNLAQPKLLLGRVKTLERKPTQAMKLYDGVLTDLSGFIVNKRADPVMMRRYSAALAEKARLSPEHSAGWNDIVLLLAPLRENVAPDALGLLAEAYLHTDKFSEAAAIAAKLHRAGYRHPDFMALLDAHAELKAAAERGATDFARDDSEDGRVH